MCLIAFDWQPDAPVTLKLAANRDEFYARPAWPLHHWADAAITGGRDAAQGGTWLAAAPGGRFAALTNVREPAGSTPLSPPSRGELVRSALETDDLAVWLESLAQGGAKAYAGFNLIALRAGALWHLHHGRRGIRLTRIPPGCHALSNATLDTPWPKVEKALSAARQARQATWHDAVRIALSDPRIAPDSRLPATGVDRETERFLSSAFIRGERYGTRALTLVSVQANGVTHLQEQAFGPWGALTGDSVTLTTASR
ncbi:NRDE family protein [Salinicola aestuarinus]|uniref:NRDE family protein n=1 Tax=Salinicola aestuarinus TaxID=1949082 RepID=UPI000DA2169A|nr:NRDE family protein [Salinicola aestuarinus]